MGDKMQENDCKFCAQIKASKDNFAYCASKRPLMKENCTTKITVALVDNNYYRGEYSGRASFDMGTPKFCPFCARPLKKEELEW